MLKQNLKGQRVEGFFVGIAYTGTVVESVEKNGEFNHIIKLDRKLRVSHKRLGHDSCYHGYKPQEFQGLNYNTATVQDSRITMTLSK